MLCYVQMYLTYGQVSLLCRTQKRIAFFLLMEYDVTNYNPLGDDDI